MMDAHVQPEREGRTQPALSQLAAESKAEMHALPRLTDWSSRLGKLPPAAIIVPIFNNAFVLAECLASIRRTVPGDTQVVLVDDHSSEAAVGRVVSEFAQQWTDTVSVRNSQNYGFVTSVNVGIRGADPVRDVVLLNSDAVLTSGWLHRLRLAVASRDDVASVSPLSNAAGVYSVPEAHRDNILPDGVSPDTCAELLALASPRLYEEVPVTCGFCMYITRAALSTLGLFDERLFHRGYGEENDFCARAVREGLANLIDDAGFVFHHHGASFGAEKHRLKKRNAAVLRGLHPFHVPDTEAWLASTRLGVVRSRYAALLAAMPDVGDVLGGDGGRGRTLSIARGTSPRAGDRRSVDVELAADRLRARIGTLGTIELTASAQRSEADLLAALVVRWNVDTVADPDAALAPSVLSALKTLALRL